jgi:hypothetical protein
MKVGAIMRRGGSFNTMRTFTKAAAFVAMIAIPGAAFAAQAAPAAPKKAAAASKAAPAKPAAEQPKKEAAAKKAPAVANKTTAGTVKSSSATSLVISKGGKDQTFVLNSSTETKGTLDAGAHVTVHYKMDGKDMVATAITVQPVKAGKAKGKK